MGKEIGKQRTGFREWMWRKGHVLKKNNLDHTEGSKHALLHSRFKFSPVQSGLLVFYPTSNIFPSLRLYANSCKHGCSEHSASLQLNWFLKKFLVNSPKLSNILCSKFWQFSDSWRSNLLSIFHFSTHCQWPNYVKVSYMHCYSNILWYLKNIHKI